MSEKYKLNPNQLKKECDLSIFNFKTTEEIQPIEFFNRSRKGSIKH